jgi:lysophospholipase L1-like esterase
MPRERRSKYANDAKDTVGIASQVESLSSSLAHKATKEELQAVASGSPKGTYATLAALQTAFPTGNTNIYVVTADGKWYYWNSTAWTAGGTYQATGIADGSVTLQKINNDSKEYWNISLDSTKYNYFADYNVTDIGEFFKAVSGSVVPKAGDVLTIKAKVQTNRDIPLGAGQNMQAYINTSSIFDNSALHLVASSTPTAIGATMVKNTNYTLETTYTYSANAAMLEFMFLIDASGNFTDPLTFMFSDFEVKLNGVLCEVKYSGYQYMGYGNTAINTDYYYGNRADSLATRKDLKVYTTKTELSAFDYVSHAELSSIGVTNPFANKRIVCFGDSLTAGDYGYEDGLPFTYGLGDMNSDTHPNIKEKNYPYFLNQYLQPLSITNRGICGGGSYFMFTDKPESASNYNFAQADIAIFMVGINEGLAGDITTDLNITAGQDYNSYAGTYLGYYARSVAKAMTDNPNIQVFLVCTPKTSNTDNGRTDAFKKTVYDNTVALAKYFSLPVIDANNLSGISPLTYSRYLNPTDKLHCNEEGYKTLAKTIGNGLKQFYRV